MEKISFKKLIYDSKKRKTHMESAEGVPYTAKNGVKVALHKEGNSWFATELTTGKLIFHREGGLPNIKAAKEKVEEVSPMVAKLLKGNQTAIQSVAPSKPKAQAKDKLPKSQQLPEDKPLPQNKSAGTYIDDRNAPIKHKTKKDKPKRPNPFAGAGDIYVTKNKIAVTRTKNSKAVRGFTKTTQTKYYEQSDSNLKLLKKAHGDTVRVGRKGTGYKKL